MDAILDGLLIPLFLLWEYIWHPKFWDASLAGFVLNFVFFVLSFVFFLYSHVVSS